MIISNKNLFALLFILTFGFWGCEQEFDNVIDSFNSEYQVTSVSPSSKIIYNSSDSLITIHITFNNSESLESVYCKIYASDNSLLSTVSLFDEGNSANGDSEKGDNIFSNKLAMSHYYPKGIYTIKYFVTDKLKNTKQIALSNFEFDNGQDNVAPVLSNLILPDSTKRDVAITFSVDVFDENGLSDVVKVYYELYRPNGTKVYNSGGISEFPLFDDGDFENDGDVTANDGRYSVQLTFPTLSTVPSGNWRFEFTAVDRSGTQSEKIIKYVNVE